MATPANPLSGVLSKLADANGYVALAVTIGSEVIPLGRWLVNEIKSISKGTDTESYEMVLQSDTAELDVIAGLATDDLNAVNAELERQGKPKLDVPTQS